MSLELWVRLRIKARRDLALKTAFLALALLAAVGQARADFAYKEIEIPVSDGSVLKADFYSLGDGVKKPTILIQTPYNKKYYRVYAAFKKLYDFEFSNSFFDTIFYNYVIVDWRGFYANKNVPAENYDRGKDGRDIIEWIARQSWSNGKVGTEGSSALGLIQYLTARRRPPHLVCRAPWVNDFKNEYEDVFYGGDLKRERIENQQKLGFHTKDVYLAHPTKDNFWKALESATD